MAKSEPNIVFRGSLDIERLKRFVKSTGYELVKKGENNEGVKEKSD